MEKKHSSKQNFALQTSFPTWRSFVKAGALFTTLSGLLLLGTGCGGDEYETVEVIDTITSEELTKGIITTVQEVKPGQFAVQDEQVVETKDSSRIVVNYLDGRKESMTIEQAKARISPADSSAMRDTALHTASTEMPSAPDSTQTKKVTKTTKSGNVTTISSDDHTTVIVDNTQPSYHSSYSPGMHTLGYVLLGSAVGYYMGKSLAYPPNPNVYRNPQQTYYNSRGYSSYSGGSSGRTYAYSSLRSTAKRSTYTRTSYKSVPSGRSGYFGGRSSSGRSSYSG